MIRHFFLDKMATIFKGSKANTGLNPIMSINYGQNVSRGLLHFDETKIKQFITDNNLNKDKLTFKLHLVNCFSVDGLPYEQTMYATSNTVAKRAASFSMEIFELDSDFDAGRGYDYDSDMWAEKHESYSEFGANWFQSKTTTKWAKPGAYNGESIAIQEFDNGKENVDIDITEYVLKAINGKNYGLGIKFNDELEKLKMDVQQHVGFFTNNTNTFFHPYIEMIYSEVISDSRECFYKEKENKLYLYANNENGQVNLDESPTCEINGKVYKAEAAECGVYFITIPANTLDVRDNTILYDTWSNIKINGAALDDVELEFVVVPHERFLQVGDKSTFKNMTIPTLSGIDDNEDLNRGEIREVVVDFRKKYTTGRKDLLNGAEYRIYVKDARREIDVFEYQPVSRAFLNNYFVIYTEDLIPNHYYIDIRVKDGREMRYFKNVLNFNVVNNITERYR